MKYHAMIFIVLLCVGCSGENAPGPMATRGYNHKLMKEAIEAAKAQLDDFISAVESGDGENFAIKESITTGHTREFIWLTDVKFEDGKFKGTVANTPTMLNGIQLGEQRTVEKAKVADWKYENAGKTHGDFTLKILINSVPENDRADYQTE